MADGGIIPPALAEMSSALRLLGNAGAHHTDEDITIPQTWKIDKLIIEYVYVGPKLLADFNRLVKQTKNNTQRTDAPNPYACGAALVPKASGSR